MYALVIDVVVAVSAPTICVATYGITPDVVAPLSVIDPIIQSNPFTTKCSSAVKSGSAVDDRLTDNPPLPLNANIVLPAADAGITQP